MSLAPLRHSAFLKFFPPPRFLEMPSVGLDMSDQTIRIIELRRKGSEFKLGKYGEEHIPEGVLDQGYIKEKGKLSELLSAAQRKYGLHFIKASIPEEKAYLFRTEVPMMDERDIKGALQYKIEENVPLSLADTVYDYRINKPIQPGDKTIHVSVTAVHMKVVASYMEVFKNANLFPVEFQIESQAMAHAAVSHEEKGTYILVALRGTRTVLAIVSQGEVEFASTLHLGGHSIIDSMKKSLNMDEAETEKIREGKEVRQSNEMFESLVSASSAFRDEIVKMIAYWNSHNEEIGDNRLIEKIILSGGGALLGLEDYLNRTLEFKVTISNPWANVFSLEHTVPPLTLREALDYMPALGLALPYD